MFNYDQFMYNMNVEFLAHSGTQRYGQFMVNYLCQTHPYIEIPEHLDPFYDNKKAPELMRYLQSISV
jgi:ABC-type enterochelin transport system ATPase subunit